MSAEAAHRCKCIARWQHVAGVHGWWSSGSLRRWNWGEDLQGARRVVGDLRLSRQVLGAISKMSKVAIQDQNLPVVLSVDASRRWCDKVWQGANPMLRQPAACPQRHLVAEQPTGAGSLWPYSSDLRCEEGAENLQSKWSSVPKVCRFSTLHVNFLRGTKLIGCSRRCSFKLFHGKVWEGTIVAGRVFLPAQVPSQLLLDLLDCILFVGIASCFVAQSPFVLLWSQTFLVRSILEGSVYI